MLCLVSEVAAMLILQGQLFIMRPDERLRNRMVPGLYVGNNISYRISSNGYRDTSFPFKQEKITVVFAGDSFTYGSGVSIVERMDAVLHDLSGWNVLNFGVGGWGVSQSFLNLDSMIADGLKFDVLVYTFCINDPQDDLRFLNYRYTKWHEIKYQVGRISSLYSLLVKCKMIMKRKLSAQQAVDTGAIESSMDWLLKYSKKIPFDYHFVVQLTSPRDSAFAEALELLGQSYLDLSGFEGDMQISRQNRHWNAGMHAYSAKLLYNRINRVRREE